MLSSSGEPAPGDSFQHIAKAKATASEVGLKVAAGGAQALKEAVWGEEMLGAEAAEVHALRVVLVGERGFIGGEYLTETVIHGRGEHQTMRRIFFSDDTPVAAGRFDDDGGIVPHLGLAG